MGIEPLGGHAADGVVVEHGRRRFGLGPQEFYPALAVRGVFIVAVPVLIGQDQPAPQRFPLILSPDAAIVGVAVGNAVADDQNALHRASLQGLRHRQGPGQSRGFGNGIFFRQGCRLCPAAGDAEQQRQAG